MPVFRRKIPGFAWETVSEDEAGGGFEVGSSFMYLEGTLSAVPMGSTGAATRPDWTVIASAGADFDFDAAGKRVLLQTDGWFSYTTWASITGDQDQVQVTILSPNSHLNSVSDYFSVDPALGLTELSVAQPADFGNDGDDVAVQVFADNAGSVGTYDVTARLLLVRLS